MSGEQKNASCKNINWQRFPRLANAWDVLWYDIVSVDQIAHGKCDCRTVILAIIFYRSLVSESSVTGLGVYARRWVYDNITPHSLCYLARVRPVVLGVRKICISNTWTHQSPIQIKVGHALDQSHSVQLRGPERVHQNNLQSWRSSRTNRRLSRQFWEDWVTVFAFYVWDKNKNPFWMFFFYISLCLLNLEPTRPNGLMGCKVSTDLVKISFTVAMHMVFSWWRHQMETFSA